MPEYRLRFRDGSGWIRIPGVFIRSGFIRGSLMDGAAKFPTKADAIAFAIQHRIVDQVEIVATTFEAVEMAAGTDT